jgi:hypothetical protein
MPNDTLSANVPAMSADHPDAAIFAAARAVAEADEHVSRAAIRADDVGARKENRRIAARDKAALTTAEADYEAALDALLALTPQTVAGARTLLQAIAKDGGWDRPKTIDALERLADGPALAGEMAGGASAHA